MKKLAEIFFLKEGKTAKLHVSLRSLATAQIYVKILLKAFMLFWNGRYKSGGGDCRDGLHQLSCASPYPRFMDAPSRPSVGAQENVSD